MSEEPQDVSCKLQVKNLMAGKVACLLSGRELFGIKEVVIVYHGPHIKLNVTISAAVA